MTGDPSVLSQRTAQIWEWCPAKFKAIRIDGLDERGAPALIDRACSDAIDAIVRGSAGAPEWSGLSPTEIARVVITGVGEDALTPAARRDALQVMDEATGPTSRLRFLIEHGEKTVIGQAYWLDEAFAALPSAEGAAYTGSLDRASWWPEASQPKSIRLTDYKTSLGTPAKYQVLDDFKAQSYALAGLALFPRARSVTVRFVLLRHGYWVEDEFVRGEPWQRHAMARLRAARLGVERALRSKIFPELPGEGCEFCPVIRRCSAFARLEQQGAPRSFSNMSADELARRREAHRVAFKLYDSAARARVEQTGVPLAFGNGAVLGPRFVDGHDLRGTYLSTLRELRSLGMSAQQELEAFRPRENETPNKVRQVLYALNPDTAKDHFERLVEPVPTTRFEVWWPNPEDKPKTTGEGDDE